MKGLVICLSPFVFAILLALSFHFGFLISLMVVWVCAVIAVIIAILLVWWCKFCVEHFDD